MVWPPKFMNSETNGSGNTLRISTGFSETRSWKTFGRLSGKLKAVYEAAAALKVRNTLTASNHLSPLQGLIVSTTLTLIPGLEALLHTLG
jgi:hypothetical protein